jgi:hypothetical protein
MKYALVILNAERPTGRSAVSRPTSSALLVGGPNWEASWSPRPASDPRIT